MQIVSFFSRYKKDELISEVTHVKKIQEFNYVDDEDILELLNQIHSTWRQILLANDLSREVSFDCVIHTFPLEGNLK